MITWPAKNPAEVADYLFDFMDVLGAGETIATRTVIAAGVTKDSDSIVAVGDEADSGVQVWLSGGMDGTATVTCTITTSGGRSFSEIALLPIGQEVVSVAQVKEYLRVLSSDEDAKIAAMIRRARLWVEDYTGLALTQRQFVELRRTERGAIRLFKGPLVSVDSVTYGEAGTYTPRTFGASTRIYASADSAWPSLDDGDAFEITYTAGFGPGEVDDRLIGAMLALIAGEFDTGRAYPEEAVEAAERCCSYLRTAVL